MRFVPVVSGRRVRGATGTTLLLVMVGVLFIWPLVMIGVSAFRTSPPGLAGGWSTKPFGEVYSSATTYLTLRNSLIYSMITKVLVLVMAVVFVGIRTRTDVRIGRILTPLMVLVFATPSLFFAISWSMLADPNVGIITHVLRDVTGGHAPRLTAESWYGLIGVTALKSTAVEYLLLLGPFLAMDRSLEEAALMAGRGRLRTFLTIDIPVLAPAITAVFVIGFVVTMGTLDIPLILGLPDHIVVFSSQVYNYIASEAFGEYAQAGSLTLLVVVLLLILVVVQQRVLRGRSFETVTGKSARRESWHVGGTSRFVLSAVVVAYGIFAFLLPLTQLILTSFEPYFGTYSHLSGHNYSAVLSMHGTTRTIVNTVIISIVGGAVAMLISMLLAYRRLRKGRSGALISIATWTPLALPGVMLGLALIWAYESVPYLRSLYSTVWLAMIGLITVTIPVTTRLAEAALAQVSTSLEQAARVSGASAARAFVGIVLRLAAPSFVVGWLIGGILIIGNLDVPVLLSSTTNQTMSVQIFQLYETGETPKAAALFCILLMMIAGAMILAAVLNASAKGLMRSRAEGWRGVPGFVAPLSESEGPSSLAGEGAQFLGSGRMS